jgi:ribosomal protein S18 acetylase RimI-like enzyme
MIVFQTADLSHIHLLAQLVNSAYRGEYSLQGWTTEAHILDGQRTDSESLAALIQNPLHQIEIALDQETNKIVGCVHLIQEEDATLYFGMLTVEPTLQTLGIGKHMMSHIESVAKALGKARIRFTVIPHRVELVAFYKRRGFKETGAFEEFPAQDPRFGLPKISDLRLQEYEKIISRI